VTVTAEPQPAATKPADAPPVVAPPPGHPRFPLIDSLRAIAALLVLVSHAVKISASPQADDRWAAPFTTGVEGVTIFFVISGFLLYRPFVNADVNGAPTSRLRDYLRRRLLRIVPAYWLALTVLAIYPGLVNVFSGDWWKHYFLLAGYSDTGVAQGLIVSWSLGVEVTFYLLLPVYAALMSRLCRGRDARGRVRFELSVLAGISLGSILLRHVDYTNGAHAGIQNSLPAFMYWFALGMALAVVSTALQAGADYRPVRWVAARPGVVWAGAIAAYLLIALVTSPRGTYTPAQWTLGYYILGGVMSFLLVLPAVFGDGRSGWPRHVLAWAPLAWLGLISYGIYLWHVPVLLWLFDHGLTWFPLVALIGAAITVACAAASYYLVERPILRFKYRRLPRSRSRRPVAGTP
jgi:peptidoglycan/LPS O-acetylase OafA/YrhL